MMFSVDTSGQFPGDTTLQGAKLEELRSIVFQFLSSLGTFTQTSRN